jgi:hypothetical protein
MATPAAVAGPEGEGVKEFHLKVDIRFARITIAAKDEERNDANMPKNLHNGAELFLRVGMFPAAEKLRETTLLMLDMYADNPDGRTGILIGRACVCWSCGHCGLPKAGADGKRPGDDDEKLPPGPCSNCGETKQINFLRVTQSKDGKKSTNIPWIEAAPLTEAEAAKKKAADLAVKKAEIEENVKKALAQREASEDSATKL